MIRTTSATQRSQMYTRGPATSFSTSASLRRQNEHASFLLKIIVPSVQCSCATYAVDTASAANTDSRYVAHKSHRLAAAGSAARTAALTADAISSAHPMKAFASYQT